MFYVFHSFSFLPFGGLLGTGTGLDDVEHPLPLPLPRPLPDMMKLKEKQPYKSIIRAKHELKGVIK